MKQSNAPVFDYLILITSLILIKLPIAFGYKDSITIRALFLLPLLFVAAKNMAIILIRKEPIIVDSKIFMLYILFILVVLVGFIRASIYRTLPYSNLVANSFIWFIGVFFSLSLFLSAQSEQIKFQYRMGLVWISAYYFSINYILYVFGIGSTELASETVLLRSIGVNSINRILFPTANGVNHFGVTTGAGLVALSIAYFYGKKISIANKLLILLSILICIIILFLTDARGAFGICLIVIFLSFFLKHKDYRWLVFLPAASPFLPFLFLYSSQRIPSQIVGMLSRGDSDFQTLNGRILVWQSAIARIGGSAESIITGFGYRGQITSGLSNDLSLIFGPAFGATAGSHNYILQWLIETGIIGTIVFILLLTAIIYRLSVYSNRNRNDTSTVIMLFVLIYCIVVGTQDTVLTIDYEEIFIMFSIICASVITLPRKESKKKVASIETNTKDQTWRKNK